MGGRLQLDHHGGGGAAHHIPHHQVGGRLQQDHHGGGGAAHHIPHHQVGGPLPILGGIDRRGGARGDGGVEDLWKRRGGVCEREAPLRGGSF